MVRRRRTGGRAAALAGAALVCAAPWPARALGAPAHDPPAPAIHVTRAAGPIALDGDLSDPAWRSAARIDTFYEYNPGDNLQPQVRTLAWLTYDHDALYVAVQCDDPRPADIRAPFVERDEVFGDQDNVALFLDTRGDRRVALQLRVNARGVQADAVSNDAADSEDFSPDFFYDTAARTGTDGWSAEFRIPLRSLRFDARAARPWTFFVVRNYPRDFRYQFASVRIPRGAGCLVCRAATLEGLVDLPAAGGAVVTPHGTAARVWSAPRTGAPLRGQPADVDAGLDVKWTPSADTALDAAVNPDFSQVESDVAQLSANNRFALFYPEKRPFFLEGVDLLQTPLDAVYTRTVTDPRWGARGTGRAGSTAYTVLAGRDDGGGLVVLPGPVASSFALQDFRSRVALARARREAGASFVGLLATLREIDGGGHNRVVGPDFTWRPSQSDGITGQFLLSDTRTPRLPDLAEEWDGRRLRSHALRFDWRHSTTRADWHVLAADVGRAFRADLGFVPQVDYRQVGFNLGRSFYRERALVTRTRAFLVIDVVDRHDGGLLRRFAQFGANLYGPRNLFVQAYASHERVTARERVFDVTQGSVYATLNPSSRLPRLTVRGLFGEDVDLDNARIGRGAELTLNALLRDGAHVALEADSGVRWLDVRAVGGGSRRLFTDQVQRLKLTVNFSTRAALRLVGQYVGTTRDPALYAVEVERRSGSTSGSLLFTYRLDWQTALYAGIGDERALDARGRLRPRSRQIFVKLSYALQP